MDSGGWYNKLATSQTFHESFKYQFSALTSSVKSKILDLVKIFGFVNRNFVSQLLGNQVKLCYTNELDRIQEIQKIFFDHFKENQPFANLALNASHLYVSTSAFSFKTTEDCVANDLKIYLSSIEFPLQEAKVLGCYSFTWIRKFVDQYDTTLQQKIRDLFACRMLKINSFTLEEQLLLFRHAGIKGYGKSLSLGHLFYLWAGDQHKTACLSLEKNFSVVRLLHKKQNRSYVSEIESPPCTFKTFVIQKTIESFFIQEQSVTSFVKLMTDEKSEQSIPSVIEIEQSVIPFIKLVADDLFVLFFESEIARQTAVHYIDYLHVLLSKRTFTFDKAFLALKRLNLNEVSKLYHILHVLLHYFHYLHLFYPNIQFRTILLESLYRLSYEERKIFDQPIQEKYYQEYFTIFGSDIELMTHFTKYLGGMFLRQTILPAKEPSPYLTLKDHVKVIQEIKDILGPRFYPEILSSFLLLQTMKPLMIRLIEEFKALKKEITKKTILEEEVFFKWRKLHQKFMEQIDVINVLEWTNWAKRKEMFLRNVEELSFLLQIATYPELHSLLQRDLRIEELNDENPYLLSFFNYLSTLTLEQALVVLELCINKNSETYHVFHSRIYYNDLLKKLCLDSDEKKNFLRKAIFSMSVQEREIFDQPIQEDFEIFELKIDSDLLHFVSKHEITLPAWGKILLRSSRSVALKKRPTPYLSLKEHIKLINAIEFFLGFLLPTNICENLLYFQTARLSCFEMVENLFSIREEIKQKYLSLIALPKDLFEEFQTLCAEFIAKGIDDIHNFNSLSESNKRGASHFLSNLSLLGSILSFVTYPRQLISFQNLINFEIAHLHRPNFSFYPMVENIPGLSWFARWVIDKEKNEYSLIVMMTNLLNRKFSYLFRLPIKVPDDEIKRNQHLSFLFSVIDRLGKENLEEQEITQQHHIPCLQDTPENRLKGLLCCSPLLQSEWDDYFKDKDNSEIRSFFTFIEMLKKNFLFAFYYIINPQEGKLIENTNIETPFMISDEGICLSNTSKGVWIKKSELISEFWPIYEEIAKKKQHLISLASIQNNPILTTSYSIIFDLKLSDIVLKGKFKWRIHFDLKRKDQDKPHFICKAENVKITLKNDLVSRTLTIQYPSFHDKQEFMDSICWHIALLYQEMSELQDF